MRVSQFSLEKYILKLFTHGRQIPFYLDEIKRVLKHSFVEDHEAAALI